MTDHHNPTGRDGGADPAEAGLFAICLPGLEPLLADEARAAGFAGVVEMPGGVAMDGGAAEALEANLRLRIATRILWRLAAFRALHLAQLDKRARKLDWAAILPTGARVSVDAACRKSRIYHDRAAAQRVARAIADAVPPRDGGPALALKVRIEDDLCTISLDTTGEPLHRRGHKQFVGKAPLREGMAAAFLARLGFDPAAPVAVVDPMCGSGTIPIEAAEMAAGLWPGRSRSFAVEALGLARPAPPPGRAVPQLFFGFDRDQGAVRGAAENAARAGVPAGFACQPVSELRPPEGLPPGIVLTNPPYGQRIGDRKLLFGLYGALGGVLRDRFAGWRVGIVTADAGLAKAAGLDLAPFGPVSHSGLKVTLWEGRV